MFIEMIKCVLAGISVGFEAFLKVLPLYEQLNGIKEQLIASALGIPVVIVLFSSYILSFSNECEYISRI